MNPFSFQLRLLILVIVFTAARSSAAYDLEPVYVVGPEKRFAPNTFKKTEPSLLISDGPSACKYLNRLISTG